MERISSFCLDFAAAHSLEAIRDAAFNVIIKKPASQGFENAAPIILQGHLDMVCQKEPSCGKDFSRDGLDLFLDGDFLKARGTTLGADNGIAVAMILAVLEDSSLSHPPIEAVFTVDEEIGLLGATKLDATSLSARRMINLDSEDLDCATVSCAGGADFAAELPIKRERACGTELLIRFSGLCGGHSGICIHEGRVNANILAGRFLNHMQSVSPFKLISVNGGDKGNAIPPISEIRLVSENTDEFIKEAAAFSAVLKAELSAREPDFTCEIKKLSHGEHTVMSEESKNLVLLALVSSPDGVVAMSREIENLVETSLNLGVLKTEENLVLFRFALRSNKKSALSFLKEKLFFIFSSLSARCEVSGEYPPWEFCKNSPLRELYISTYTELFGAEPRIEAIHAGLECGVFSDKLNGLDCISIGPQMYGVHTTSERLSVSSVMKIYELLVKMLSLCK